MKNIILLLILLGCTHTAHAQIITIQDQATGRPLELVSLSSEDRNTLTTTNAKGKADISALKNAEKITIRVLGYITEVKSYAELGTIDFLFSMEASNITIDEVVVSATRWNQFTSSVPSKIISISSKEVALQNPQTAADLLGISGQVFIQKSQQGGGSPMIRGFATNRLVYTIDGVRMNTAIYRGGNLQNVISLDPFAIEHTEVLFGPGSVIYGSDAIGGVMSFLTLTPQFSLDDKPFISGKAVTRYATANSEKTAHLDVNIGWKKWAFTTSISAYDYDDLKQGSHGPDEFLRPFYVKRQNGMDVVVNNKDPKVQTPSGYSQLNLMQKARFKPAEYWDFQYGLHYSETSEYARYDRHQRTRNGIPRYGEWSYGPQKWMMNNLNTTHSKQNKYYDQLSVRLAIQHFEESRISRNFNQPNRETRVEKVDAYSANVDFVKALGEQHQLYYGFEAVYDDVNSTGTDLNIDTAISQPGPSRYPQATWASYAAYISDQFTINEQVLLQAGLRYNLVKLYAEFDTGFYPFPFEETSSDNGNFTGSLGVVYTPAEDWVISSNASTAFRAPNVDDIGKVFDSEPGSVVVPNPDLEAEDAYNIDLGITKLFDDVVKIDVTAYYTRLKNALVRRDFTLNGQDEIIYDGQLSQVQAIQNAAVANVYGIEAGLEVKLPGGLSLSSDFNFQDGEEELDGGTISRSRHTVPSFGVFRLTYGTENLDMQLYLNYSGKRDFKDLPESEKGKTEIYAIDKSGNPYAASWYTLNYKVNYRLSDMFTVTGGIENITDQRYRPYSSGISDAGRNFILALRADF